MNPVIVPLDVPSLDRQRELLDRLADSVELFKVGKQLFTATGPASVELVHSYGKRLFLDLKYHDIPNTVAGAVQSAADLGVWMLNVHVGGGRAMLEAARDALKGAENPPLLIGVTVLTSLDDGLWREVYGQGAAPVGEQATRMATLAKDARMDGVVASPLEIASIREACGPDFKIVTPGVRPSDAVIGDQRRTMTPGEAVAAGSDYVVIGRPITQSDDPAGAVARILDDIAANA